MTGHGIDRRRFLRGLGLGAAAIAGGPLLAACGGGSSGLSGDQGGGGGSRAPAAPSRRSTSGTTSTARPAPSRRSSATPRSTPTPRSRCSGRPGDYTSKLNSGLLSSSGPDVFESSVNIDQVKSGQVVALDDIIADVKSDFTEADIKSSTGRRQDLPGQDGRRHGRAVLPQEHAGEGRRPAADHDRRADRRVEGADHEGPEGPVHRQRRRRDPSFGGGSLLGPILWTRRAATT